MRCSQCDRDNPADASFCAGCGERLAITCRGCDRPNSPDASFCNGCGRPLDEVTPATPPLPERSPQDYTPKHLADKILTTKSVIEGERKLVTVLFADLKGSMEVSEGIDPEQWHAIMDRFFGILADGVHRFDGTVNQYTGDGIMALFGAPITHEDHAHRACYAALHLRDGLREYGHELKREKGITFSFRMGINSGEVVVGKIGDDLRMDYTAQGHSVGLAARMEQLASPDTVYITDQTANLVTGFFDLRNLGSFNVKGVQEPTVAHELVGVGELRTRLDVSQARGFSKFVGRSEEMDILEAALARAQAGHGQVVGVVADAGTGKSRLCFEFLERCRARDIHTYQAHGVAHGKAIPFLPILQLFRDFFAVTDKDSDERIREKVAGRLLLLDEKFRENLPLVFEFLGAPDPENPAPRMDPDAWRRQFYSLVKRVTQERGKKNMAVTLIEDLHWFDAGSDGFLEPLIEATATTRNLLLLNFRPEYHAAWMQRSYYQQLPLLPLDAAAIREMLDDLLGNDPSLEGLAERVHEKTLGNPFFSEEVVQSLVEAGSLRGTRGAYRLATSIDKLAVPATVQAVLGARIDRLMEREKQVLQTGSVIGKKFPESVLEKISELPSSDLSDALRQLISGEFIFEEAIYPEAEYAFKHPLTQEVAYHSQLGARRAQVHAAAARIIEDLYADKLEEQAALLAHHWEEADEPLTAARWNRRAAQWAGEADAAEAVRHWRKVHSLLDATGSTAETDELRVEASSELLQMGWRVGMPAAESDALFAETEPIATRLDDPKLHARLVTSYGGARGTAGNARVYFDNAMRAAELARRVGDQEFEDSVAIFQTYGSHLIGRLADSQAICERVISRGLVPVTNRYFGIDPYVWHRHMRAENCMHMGRFPQALAFSVEALEAARARDEFECEIWTNSVMGSIRYWAGEDVEGALRNGRRALELSENVGSPVNRAIARFNLACAENFAEQFEAAVDACEAALEIMDGTAAGGIWRSWTLANLSEAHAGAGDFAAARSRAEEGIERARSCGTPVWEADCLIALARALLLSGDGEADDVASALDGAEVLVHATGANARLLPLQEVRAGLASHSRDTAVFESERAKTLALYDEMSAAGREPRLVRLFAPGRS